jgi:polyhydroxybutyrate depolymerase
MVFIAISKCQKNCMILQQIFLMKKSFFFIIISITLFAACGEESKEDNKDLVKPCYSNTNAQTLSHNNELREYIIYIPTSYNGTSKVPLLFNFHGYGGGASEYMDYADLRVLAESDTFILVYPQGSCLNGLSHWNPSLPGGDNKSSVDDLGFVEALINQVSSDYNIDSERIYACGYSNGGMFAYGLANYKSELFAAVGSVSGTILDFNGTTSHPMPVIHLHGTSDGVIPYNGNDDYNSAQSVLDYWVGFNNTVTNPTVNSDSNGGMSIEHYLYDQGDSGVSVAHYKFIGGDHVWFSATYQGQNTSQLIWSFVSKYDINGLR